MSEIQDTIRFVRYIMKKKKFNSKLAPQIDHFLEELLEHVEDVEDDSEEIGEFLEDINIINPTTFTRFLVSPRVLTSHNYKKVIEDWGIEYTKDKERPKRKWHSHPPLSFIDQIPINDFNEKLDASRMLLKHEIIDPCENMYEPYYNKHLSELQANGINHNKQSIPYRDGFSPDTFKIGNLLEIHINSGNKDIDKYLIRCMYAFCLGYNFISFYNVEKLLNWYGNTIDIVRVLRYINPELNERGFDIIKKHVLSIEDENIRLEFMTKFGISSAKSARK